jgi:hypothetical protein
VLKLGSQEVGLLVVVGGDTTRDHTSFPTITEEIGQFGGLCDVESDANCAILQ